MALAPPLPRQDPSAIPALRGMTAFEYFHQHGVGVLGTEVAQTKDAGMTERPGLTDRLFAIAIPHAPAGIVGPRDDVLAGKYGEIIDDVEPAIWADPGRLVVEER